jgi:hypothetical protein
MDDIRKLVYGLGGPVLTLRNKADSWGRSSRKDGSRSGEKDMELSVFFCTRSLTGLIKGKKRKP